jgi:hypothetical protein
MNVNHPPADCSPADAVIELIPRRRESMISLHRGAVFILQPAILLRLFIATSPACAR